MSQDSIGMADIGEIYQRLCQGLVDTAPPGWASVGLGVMMVDTTVEHGHGATAPDGSPLRCAPLGPDAQLAVEDLQSAMYQEGNGAWLSMTCSVTADGQIGIDVDHEDQPGWEVFVPDAAYAADLARFPREDEHVPAWMRTILDGAGA